MILLLLVDDDEESRELIQAGLKRLGYTVSTAATGKEGIEAARGESPNLILMDMCMPEMDGFEAVKQLRANAGTTNIPIIALTGLNKAADVQRAIDVGCDNFQTKPLNLASLHIKIRRLVWRAENR
ncbi:MAG: response regulator [Bryobacteraceae bacterium]|jgi:CheY-like chemotaxis protein